MNPLRVPRPFLAGLLAAVLAGAGCNSKSPTAPTTTTPTPTPTSSPNCATAVSDAPSVPLTSSGADFSVSVAAPASCAWSATIASPFIVPAGATSATGPGSVRFTVQANAGVPRQGRVTVAGRELSIVQDGTATVACAFDVTPTDHTVGAPGGNLAIAISVTSGADCGWTAASQTAFLTVTSATAGSGPATVTLNVAANAGAARVGTMTIAGRVVTVLQEATGPPTCAFTVSPTQSAQPAAGGTVAITVTRTQGTTCPWIAQTQSPFLSISGASSGVDNGTVTIAVAPNGGSARGGSVTVAGNIVSITQAAPSLPCVLTITPTQANVLAAGGTTFTIVAKTQGDVCPWTAQSQSSFLTIISGSSGTDSGGVTVRVDPNAGGDRQGTLLVAGRTFTVNQSGANSPCAFSVNPSTLTAGAALSSTMIYVTQIAGANCAWSAQSSAGFVTVDPTSGVMPVFGYAPIMVFIAANTGAARTATVTIGNATLTISQAGTLPSSAAAVLAFTSDAGDNVGQGQSNSFTYTGSQFEVTVNTAAGTMNFNTPFGTTPSLGLSLAAPLGQPLAPGYYPTAQRFASSGVVGVDFGFNSRGCNATTGRLLVQEAVYSGNTVQRFHARFEQHCEGSSPALRGTIWIDAAGSTSPPALAAFPAPGSGNTLFTYTSDPGDVIGGGGSGSYTLTNATFTPSTTNGQEVVIAIRSQPPGVFNWSLLFGTTTGTLPLAGAYDPATDPAVPGGAAMRIFGPGSCNATTGKFTVLESVYGPGGTVQRFHATFEIHCGTATAALRGEIYILADSWR